MCISHMDLEDVWPVDQDNLHVAPDRESAWKVLPEGQPTAASRHETRDEALDAARALARAEDLDEPRIKVHNHDGTLDRVLRPDRI